MAVPFTHHYTILSQVKEQEARAYYIRLCANEHLSVDALEKAIKNDEYSHKGALPNNFDDRIPSSKLARKAVMAFKDEYFLDFINTEEIGIRDEEDIDERVVEMAVVGVLEALVVLAASLKGVRLARQRLTPGGQEDNELFWLLNAQCVMAWHTGERNLVWRIGVVLAQQLFALARGACSDEGSVLVKASEPSGKVAWHDTMLDIDVIEIIEVSKDIAIL